MNIHIFHTLLFVILTTSLSGCDIAIPRKISPDVSDESVTSSGQPKQEVVTTTITSTKTLPTVSTTPQPKVPAPTPKPKPLPKPTASAEQPQTTLPTPKNDSAITPNAKAILSETNKARAAFSLAPLTVNPTLNSIALSRVNNMFDEGYFSHTAPDGTTFIDLIENAKYRYSKVGENIALGDFDSSASIVDAWMKSPGHRANILDPHYTEIGIAVMKRRFEGQDQWIAVQIFAHPR